MLSKICRTYHQNLTKQKLGFVYRWFSSEPISRRCAALWGNGDHGRLGFGDLNSQWRPKIVPFSVFGNQSVKDIACGGAHTLFLTEMGQVYATGLNDFGQLGASDNCAYSMEPLEVSGLDKEIVHIAAGYHHSCAITVDGDLYMWGRNSSGQLGLGKTLASEHSVAVTDGGEALSWGGGRSGRLGHGQDSSIWGFFKSPSEYIPRSIKNLEGVKVKKVAAGLLHSACIDANGSVFVFGETPKASLGFREVSNETTPSMMRTLPSSQEVACGAYHTCVITSAGELYTWGLNDNGCLGIGSTEVFHSPERVQGLKSPVDKVSCGWKHTAAISEGNIYTWGWGGSHGTFSDNGHSSGGQLGHGSDVDYIKPALVKLGKNMKALQVSCGFNHTGAILECTEGQAILN